MKKTEGDIKEVQKCIDEKLGVKESDTGLAAPNPWDLVSDRERMAEQPLQVAQCAKTIPMDPKKVKLDCAVNPAGAPQPVSPSHLRTLTIQQLPSYPRTKGADEQDTYGTVLSSSVPFDVFMFSYS